MRDPIEPGRVRFSEDELRNLAARAMPLRERLDGYVVPATGADDQAVTDSRLARWREAVTGDSDPARFERRLAFDGLDEERCRRVLGDVRLAEGQSLPRWATALNAILESCRPADRHHILDAEAPIPFEDVLVPFVRYAEAQIPRPTEAPLAANAKTALLRQLLASLSRSASLAMGAEFDVFRAMADPLSILLPSSPEGSAAPSRRVYSLWVDRMLNGGLLDLFRSYPVLARLLVTGVENWIASACEFLSRLECDLPVLAASFNDGRSLGDVAALRTGLSDPHHGARSVIGVEFACGVKVLYKPKDLGAHEAWQNLLSWLNQHGPPEALKTLRVVNRGTHGWVEHAEHVPCETVEQARLYYRRAGMLLCLVYGLKGTDCHCENVLACGEHPVLIDTETLVRPRFVRTDEAEHGTGADALARDEMRDSVLATSLLPRWRAGQAGRSLDSSGLGAEQNQDTGLRALVWENVNTNRMRPAYRDAIVQPDTNELTIDARPLTPKWFETQIIDGFDGVFRCLTDCRDHLLDGTGPLAAFGGKTVRLILRDTVVYGRCLRRLLHPEFLRDGADRSIEIERLTQALIPLDADEPAPQTWAVYEAERRAMERLDIPLFTANSSATHLAADGETVAENVFREPGFERVAAGLRSLCEGDLTRQINYIRSALELRYPPTPSRTRPLRIPRALAIGPTSETQRERTATSPVS